MLFYIFLTEMRLIMLGFLEGVERNYPSNKYFTFSIGYARKEIADDHMPFFHHGTVGYDIFYAALCKGISL